MRMTNHPLALLAVLSCHCVCLCLEPPPAGKAAPADAGDKPAGDPAAGPSAGPGQDGPWIRPSGPGAPLIWGRKDGIVFGLPSRGGLRGPRGLVRAGILPERKTAPDLINFIAFEPVVGGRKGLSELEPSRLDDVPGKRLSVSGPVEGTLSKPAPGPGDKETGDELLVTVLCEPFENGARVRAELRVSADRPEELRITLFAAEGSAAIEENTVTATMGNYGRLRRVTLRDRWLDSREVFKGYKGTGFADHPDFPLGELPRLAGGDVLVAAVTDEKDPAAVKMDGLRTWEYRSVPLTQYWRVPAREVGPSLRLRLNGRRVYWLSRREIPGGIAFENFELRSRFAAGQTFIFGLSRRSPVELGVQPGN